MQVKNFLTSGMLLQKHSNNAAPRARHVYVTTDLKFLVSGVMAVSLLTCSGVVVDLWWCCVVWLWLLLLSAPKCEPRSPVLRVARCVRPMLLVLRVASRRVVASVASFL